MNKRKQVPAAYMPATAPQGEQRIQEMLHPLVDALTNPDEPSRQAAVEHVLHSCLPAVVSLLIDRLVDLLGGEGTVRQQALASVVQFGARSLPSLTLRFTRTRSAALQAGIVEALGRIARTLGSEGHFDLAIELMVLPRFAVDESIRRGIAKVTATLRRAGQQLSQTS